mmetsp:Transcript_155145/g.496060  ORF Transcript_155145/g.496060 Transcript_155145/m.496060 type:complete len:154 (-) Transcript_155145:237-698(-)
MQACGEDHPGPQLSSRYSAFAEGVAGGSDDSDKGEDNDYSEGYNGQFGEDGGFEHFFIGDEEGGGSGSSSTTSTARRSKQLVKQEAISASTARPVKVIDMQLVEGLKLKFGENVIMNGGNQNVARAILADIHLAYGGAEAAPVWAKILAEQFC